MRYYVLPFGVAVSLLLTVALANQSASAPEPLLYELAINGESFIVEAGRATKLSSKQRPGTTYDVALRVAQMQRLALNRLQLDYDRGFSVSQSGNEKIRTATLGHELGFTLAVTDLGEPLSDESRQKVLDTLRDSLQQSFRDAKAMDIVVGKPHDRKFAAADAKGLTIQYQDGAGVARTCLVYVLHGERFAASCIVQFLDDDHETVLPLVKRTLDTLQPRRNASR